MVTTGAGDIAAVTGAPAAGQPADAGGDNSVFAQLLGDAVAAASVPATASEKYGNGKSASAGADTDMSQSEASAADLLALCGMPPIPVTPTAVATTAVGVGIDKSSADMDVSANATVATPDATIQALAAGMAPAAVMTPPATNAASTKAEVQPATAARVQGADARASRAADLRWLRSSLPDNAARVAVTESETSSAPVEAGIQNTLQNTQTETAAPAARTVAQPATQQAAAQPVDQTAGQTAQNASVQKIVMEPGKFIRPDDGVNELPAVQDKSATSPEQPVQNLMTQVAPVMDMMTAQLREARFDERSDAANDASNTIGAVNTAPLQPAGTQLASDAPVLELSPRHQLHATVGTHQWATELGNKLTMLATRDTQSATLYMTPADLGPVQVRIDLNQDQSQASVWFTAEHADTRSALEQSLPKLRELFSAQGMSLTDAGVFGDRSRQQQAESSFTSSRFHNMQYEDSEALADTATVRTISLGLLDAYA